MLRPRRIVAALLVVLGGLFLLIAPETKGGVILIVMGVVIETVGIALEHRR